MVFSEAVLASLVMRTTDIRERTILTTQMQDQMGVGVVSSLLANAYHDHPELAHINIRDETRDRVFMKARTGTRQGPSFSFKQPNGSTVSIMMKSGTRPYDIHDDLKQLADNYIWGSVPRDEREIIAALSTENVGAALAEMPERVMRAYRQVVDSQEKGEKIGNPALFSPIDYLWLSLLPEKGQVRMSGTGLLNARTALLRGEHPGEIVPNYALNTTASLVLTVIGQAERQIGAHIIPDKKELEEAGSSRYEFVYGVLKDGLKDHGY